MIIILFILLNVCTSVNGLKLNIRQQIIPVFHNVHLQNIDELVEIVKYRQACTISFRHSEALSSLREFSLRLKTINSMCSLGASTIKTVEEVGCYIKIVERKLLSIKLSA